MVRKLIYLMQVPLSLREFDTFGLKYFLSSGYAVEVWECTAFLNPQLGQQTQRPNSIGAEGQGAPFAPFPLGPFAKIQQFTTPQQLIEGIEHEATSYMRGVVFINLLPKNHKTLRIFAALNASFAQSGAQSVEVRTNAIPLGAGRFIKRIKKINPVRLFDFILRRASFWQHRAGRPTCIIYGGSICQPGDDAVAPGGRLISAHALDYDNFISYCKQQQMQLEPGAGSGHGLDANVKAAPGVASEATPDVAPELASQLGPETASQATQQVPPEATPQTFGKTSPQLAPELASELAPQLAPQLAGNNIQNLACTIPAPQKQIVFLDQNLPFHSDFKVLKRKPPVTPEVYFSALRKFFDELEKTLGMPVIIAAHPRANYSDGNDYFGGRKLICGQTLPLVCQSSLVLTHHSTAVNIAVMARRPVLVLTSKQLEATEGATINLIAKNLGTRPVNIDCPYPGWPGWNEHLLEFDNAAYTAYFNKYIKEPGSPNLPFWQILEQNWLQADLNSPSAQAPGPENGPENGLEHRPEHSTDRGPEHGPAQAPAQASNQAPVRLKQSELRQENQKQGKL